MVTVLVDVDFADEVIEVVYLPQNNPENREARTVHSDLREKQYFKGDKLRPALAANDLRDIDIDETVLLNILIEQHKL